MSLWISFLLRHCRVRQRAQYQTSEIPPGEPESHLAELKLYYPRDDGLTKEVSRQDTWGVHWQLWPRSIMLLVHNNHGVMVLWYRKADGFGKLF